jgi:AcrR family transcriptional regulator
MAGRSPSQARAAATVRSKSVSAGPSDLDLGAASPAGEDETPKGTRERILDIACDLFIDKGFDKTSLREIAEKLGFSKAALYYHFASKDDILLALHYRLHEVLQDTLGNLSRDETGVVSWTNMFDRVIDQMLTNRKLFVLHERNRAALEQLHSAAHETDHEDFEERFRSLLADKRLPLRDRVRLSCSLGAVLSGLFLAGDLFSDIPATTLGELLRDVVRDVLDQKKTTAP